MGVSMCNIKKSFIRKQFHDQNSGGESIKEINRRSGAHVEIDKSQRGANATEGADKMFVIRGTSEQIQYAQQLIYEKITGVSLLSFLILKFDDVRRLFYKMDR